MRDKFKIPTWKEPKLERDIKKFFKTESRRAVKWLFFYTYKDNMDAFLHIVDVLALVYIGIRLIGG